MKQILMFDTAIATSNLGDEVILDGVKEGLKEILDNSLTFRLGTHIENWSPLKIQRNWKAHVLCDKADYKFVCGTNCLTNDLKHKRQWEVNNFNKILYKDCILVGVGRISDYDMPTKYSQKLYNDILSKKYKHSVRDEGTKRVLEKMGFKAINTGCPTLWGFTDEKCSKIPKKKSKNVIISVSGYDDQSNKEKDQEMIDIINNNYKNVYAWIQTVSDEEYLKKLNNTENMKCIYSLNKFAELCDNGNIDYVGTRLHGGVYAMQHNCRSIVISIDERARGFHESNNIPIIERDNIEQLDEMINSEFETKIKVNREAINEFISQFK